MPDALQGVQPLVLWSAAVLKCCCPDVAKHCACPFKIRKVFGLTLALRGGKLTAG